MPEIKRLAGLGPEPLAPFERPENKPATFNAVAAFKPMDQERIKQDLQSGAPSWQGRQVRGPGTPSPQDHEPVSLKNTVGWLASQAAAAPETAKGMALAPLAGIARAVGDKNDADAITAVAQDTVAAHLGHPEWTQGALYKVGSYAAMSAGFGASPGMTIAAAGQGFNDGMARAQAEGAGAVKQYLAGATSAAVQAGLLFALGSMKGSAGSAAATAVAFRAVDAAQNWMLYHQKPGSLGSESTGAVEDALLMMVATLITDQAATGITDAAQRSYLRDPSVQQQILELARSAVKAKEIQEEVKSAALELTVRAAAMAQPPATSELQVVGGKEPTPLTQEPNRAQGIRENQGQPAQPGQVAQGGEVDRGGNVEQAAPVRPEPVEPGKVGARGEVGKAPGEVAAQAGPLTLKVAPGPKAEGDKAESASKAPPAAETPKLGPGAAGTADPSFSRTSIKELTNVIADQVPAGADLGERATIAQRISDKAYAAKDSIAAGLASLRARTAAAYSAYKSPPQATDYNRATRRWTGAMNKLALLDRAFRETALKKVPDRTNREAITVFREAGGDRQKLLDQAKELAGNPKTARYAAIFRRAASLSAGHETIANEIERHNQDTLDEAKRAGVLKDGLDNYMMHVWRDNPAALRRIVAESQATGLITKPSFTKQRTIPDYFTGIKLGFKPAGLDFSDLVSAHERSFRNALAARAYIKELNEAKASDGRPLVTIKEASAKPMTGGDKPDPAYMIRPNLRPAEEYADYKTVAHPALQGWRWAAKTPEGQQIFVQGDMLVHPEAYRSIHNNLTPSAIRNWEVRAMGQTFHLGRMALDANQEIKGMILSLSGFHQVTLATHAMEHRVVPAAMRDINLDDPIHSEAIDHGLMIAHYHAAEAFGEGVEGGGSGLVTKIPGIGPMYHAYTEYLFNSYMPRLKMAMYEKALERNVQRYEGKLSRDQICDMTADQANAAFGGLNYKVLGRNQTMQDVLRLTLMAPDFLEARTRFSAQAAKPYGREQLVALSIGGAAMYTATRMLNMAVSDDHNAHWLDHPLSLVYHGKEYSLRTIQGDLLRAVTSPTEFIRNRLSPLLGVGVERLTGRDYWGKKESAGKQLVTTAERSVPIPLQPWTHGKDPAAERVLESLLKMTGINAKKDTGDDTAKPAHASTANPYSLKTRGSAASKGSTSNPNKGFGKKPGPGYNNP
jgi:hypothetical protein